MNYIVSQVGDGDADHGFWGPPQNMNMARPSCKATTSNPGTEAVNEAAAALAAASILFKDDNAAYSTTLLNHAKQLYDFGKNHRGSYANLCNAWKFYK